MSEVMQRSLSDRFWKKVNKKGPRTSDLGRCWSWTAALDDKGYGRIAVSRNGSALLAHRVSWMLHYGEMPDKTIKVCHKCDNPACVRPEHLFLGSQKENLIDMAQKGRASFKKLKPDEVLEIRRLSGKVGQRTLAGRFGVSRAMVRSIQKGESWAWLTEEL